MDRKEGDEVITDLVHPVTLVTGTTPGGPSDLRLPVPFLWGAAKYRVGGRSTLGGGLGTITQVPSPPPRKTLLLL